LPTDANPAATNTSRENLALGLGLAALITWVIAVIISGDNDEHGWIWPVMAGLGLAAVVAGLSAGPGRPRGRALIGTVLGGVLVLLFLGFVIAEA